MTLPPIEVLPRDLSPYRTGNVGVDYVHRFVADQPGPHVLINALTHGNEFCGMFAACDLLDRGVRPRIGTLTVSFANVAAYESFDVSRPFESRQITHNLNRIWSEQWLDGPEESVELRRAREMREIVAEADHILDIHSTAQDVAPFWVYPGHPRNATVARALPKPLIHLVMPDGMSSGTPLIEYGPHGKADGPGAAMVLECGQHFRRASVDLAISVTEDFLGHFGLIEREQPKNPSLGGQGEHRAFEMLTTHVIRTAEFSFVRPLVGFEVFAKGELIAVDGSEEIRAPCADCTIFMPTRLPIIGREGVYLTRPLI
jgi:predicted deacylase